MKIILRLNGFELESENKLDQDLIKEIREHGLRVGYTSYATSSGKRRMGLVINNEEKKK